MKNIDDRAREPALDSNDEPLEPGDCASSAEGADILRRTVSVWTDPEHASTAPGNGTAAGKPTTPTAKKVSKKAAKKGSAKPTDRAEVPGLSAPQPPGRPAAELAPAAFSEPEKRPAPPTGAPSTPDSVAPLPPPLVWTAVEPFRDLPVAWTVRRLKVRFTDRQMDWLGIGTGVVLAILGPIAVIVASTTWSSIAQPPFVGSMALAFAIVFSIQAPVAAAKQLSRPDPGRKRWRRRRWIIGLKIASASTAWPLALMALRLSPSANLIWVEAALSALAGLVMFFIVHWEVTHDQQLHPEQDQDGHTTGILSLVLLILCIAFILVAMLTTPFRFERTGQIPGPVNQGENGARPTIAPMAESESEATTSTTAPCPESTGASASDSVLSAMTEAAGDTTHPDFACPRLMIDLEGGSFRYDLPFGQGLVIGSEQGAGLVSGTFQGPYEEVADSFSLRGLNGQITSEFPCGTALVNAVVGKGGEVVMLGYQPGGPESRVVIVPTGVAAKVGEHLKLGQVLIATGSATEAGSGSVAQTFRVVDQPGPDTILTGRYTTGYSDPKLVDETFTVMDLFRACNPGESVPPELEFGS